MQVSLELSKCLIEVSYCYDLLNCQIYVRTLDVREQGNLYDGDSAPVKRYLRGIGLSHVQMQDNNSHAYQQDEQGSTAYITRQSIEAENIYQYDVFGNLIEQKEA